MLISVRPTPTTTGWTCKVRIEGHVVSEHTVTLTEAERERLAPDSTVEDLVTRSFEFLLEREPSTSILRRFALTDIEGYFPEYPAIIGPVARPSRQFPATGEKG